LNTLWHKIWADLWLSKGRTLLAISSIAAGVFCVGTLVGMIDLQLSKMDAAHQQSQPSHINLILRSDANLNLLTEIKALSGVLAVDTLTQLTIRFKQPGDITWTTGTLIIRPDYAAQHFDKTVLQSGNWPGGNTIAIENLSANHTGLNLGDSIVFDTTPVSQALQIAGVVRHPFVKPPKFGGQVHFFADTSAATLFGVPVNSYRQLLVQIAPPYSADKARSIAKEIRTVLASQQVAVNATLLQDPEKHWGRPFFAGINGVLQIMALAALALASVLILNTMSAHISQQTDQIGVMKSLGASKTTLFKLYLYETLIIAFAAITLAMPLALFAAHISSCTLLSLFNIECGKFAISPRAIGIMLLGGLLIPVLAVLVPIVRGATMSVREAIASYGLGGDFGSNRFDSWIEHFGACFLPTLYAAALGNLFRRKGRLVLTQSVLIISGVVFLVLTSLVASVNLTLDNEMLRSRYAVRLGFSVDQPEQQVIDIVKSITAIQSIEFWQRLPIELSKNDLALRQKGSLGTQLLSVPAATESYQPLIEQGRWLEATDAGKRVLVISADTAELNDLAIGDYLEVRLGTNEQAWQIIGFYRWLAGSNYAVEPVYAPLESVREITQHHDLVSFALLNAPITTITEEADYLRAIKQKLQDNAIKLDVYTTQAKLEQRQFARNQFNPVIGTLLGLATMIAAVGGIGLSGALAISVLQRGREIGVLRAIGAPSKAIYRLFLLEGLLHGLVAWSISAPLASLAAEPVARQLGKTMLGIQLDFMFDTKAIFYWLGIVLVIAWLASYFPARRAAGLTVRDSLSG
jgi:putative ABC transport system permease protein